MGATNKTTYYELSQFIGTDKPAWLQDYNGDMLKIDTAINNAKVAADNAANAASAAQGDATTALGDIASLNTTVGTISNTLNTAVGNINTINSLIGNGEPTTQDKTLIGAINELDAGSNAIHAQVTKFNNTYALGGVSVITRTGDGAKTIREILDEIATTIKGYVTDFTKIRIDEISISGYAPMSSTKQQLLLDTSDVNISFNGIAMPASDRIQVAHCELKSAGNSTLYYGRIASDSTVTVGDASNTVLPSGNIIAVQIEPWKNIGTIS